MAGRNTNSRHSADNEISFESCCCHICGNFHIICMFWRGYILFDGFSFIRPFYSNGWGRRDNSFQQWILDLSVEWQNTRLGWSWYYKYRVAHNGRWKYRQIIPYCISPYFQKRGKSTRYFQNRNGGTMGREWIKRQTWTGGLYLPFCPSSFLYYLQIP